LLLKDKNAVVFGGGGSMGGAIARAFAREGANVFLAGRSPKNVQSVADDIRSSGGTAHTSVLDAHDPAAVEAYLGEIIDIAGRLDVSMNTINPNEVQGVPLVDMPLNDFLTPVTESARTNFLTATASARHMIEQGSGVILTLSSSAARESGPLMGGFSLACAALECLTRTLAAEVGHHGIRVVAIRPNLIPETKADVDLDQFQDLIDGTSLGRLPLLVEVANTCAFAASEHAGAITGAVLNLTCGAIVD
jgi:3-oxoacyl-[acyl-carrier protein] reductase